MSKAITRTKARARPARFDPELVASATRYAANSRAKATETAYRADVERFVTWCRSERLDVADARVVALYLSWRADHGFRVSTIERELASIADVFRRQGAESPRKHPAVRDVLRGIRKTITVARREARPILVSDLRAMCTALPDSLQGIRDRAVLCLGFAGAFRRSELVSLSVEDLEFAEDGLHVRVRRSKTDQEGRGVVVGIPYGNSTTTCPIRSVRRWMTAAAIERGTLFRSVRANTTGGALDGKDVGRILRRAAALAGLEITGLSAHSLRAGLATSAAKAGKSDRAIMRQGRWSSRASMDRYVRDADLLDENNAAAGLGL